MGKGLTLYFKISPHTTFHFSYVWGEPTHFVHEPGGDGRPLNKEWSVSIMFLWFYFSVSYDTGWRD